MSAMCFYFCRTYVWPPIWSESISLIPGPCSPTSWNNPLSPPVLCLQEGPCSPLPGQGLKEDCMLVNIGEPHLGHQEEPNFLNRYFIDKLCSPRNRKVDESSEKYLTTERQRIIQHHFIYTSSSSLMLEIKLRTLVKYSNPDLRPKPLHLNF
jgi:hypothetical protein